MTFVNTRLRPGVYLAHHLESNRNFALQLAPRGEVWSAKEVIGEIEKPVLSGKTFPSKKSLLESLEALASSPRDHKSSQKASSSTPWPRPRACPPLIWTKVGWRWQVTGGRESVEVYRDSDGLFWAKTNSGELLVQRLKWEELRGELEWLLALED